MHFPFIGLIAQVTLLAFPICWLFRFLEHLIVGVKSDFWDAFLVIFLYLIAMTTASSLLIFLMNGWPWYLYDIFSFVSTVLIWIVLIRGILKHDLGKCIKISITMAPLLYAIPWLLSLAGIHI
tara:strand:- start:492 stop:860 length:369 start_codon:yes stop_codon:yes gene_type:complete